MKTIKPYIFLITWLFAFPSLLPAQQNYFSKVYYDPNAPVFAWSCARSYDNHYFIAGERDGNGLLIKADSVGDIIWSKTIGINGFTPFNQVISTIDSCVLLIGRCYNITQTNTDIFYCKVNTNGDTLWSGIIDLGTHEITTSVAQTNDKGFIISGISLVNPIYPVSYILICKLDSLGIVIWTKKIAVGNHSNYIYSVKQTTDGGYIATGYIEDTTGTTIEYKTYLLKLFSDGTTDWVKTYQAIPATDNISGCDVISADNGFSVLVEGYNNIGMGIFHTDSTGNILWSRDYQVYNQSSFFNEDVKPRLRKTLDGGYMFATNGQNPYQSFIKTDSVGLPVWSKMVILGTTNVLETPDTAILLVGNGPLFGVKDKYLNHDHIGIIKTDSADNSFNNCNNNITITSDTLLLTVGTQAFTSVAAGVAASSHPVISVTALTEVNGCVDVYGSVEENTAQNTLLAYPNPNHGKFQLQTNDVLYDASINISDMLGRCVYQNVLPEIRQHQLDISDQPDGIYYITLTTREAQYRTKLMIIK